MISRCLALVCFVSILFGAVSVQAKPDFSQFDDVKERKREFFTFFYPLIEKANREILTERTLVRSLNSSVQEDAQKLLALCQKYGGACQNLAQAKRVLLTRIDVVPASLTLAQAANESAWGRSRFARQANNYFGIWCFTSGCGLVPKQRAKGQHHEVRRFANAYESVRGYMFNLNTNRSYQYLRDLRAKRRAQDKPLSGEALTAGLVRYSQRGQAYVNEIRSMIRFNKLQRYDRYLEQNLTVADKR